MDKKLPIYDIVLSEDDLSQGVGMISLVDDPAIKVNWIKLAKQTSLSFKSDKEKQMLYGPFLIPNMLIYRSDEHNGEYYVTLVYNLLIKDGLKIGYYDTDYVTVFGTPEEVESFESWATILGSGQVKNEEQLLECYKYWKTYHEIKNNFC